MRTAVLLKLDGALNLRGWQWIFIAEGVATAVFGIFCLLSLPDGPDTVSGHIFCMPACLQSPVAVVPLNAFWSVEVQSFRAHACLGRHLQSGSASEPITACTVVGNLSCW